MMNNLLYLQFYAYLLVLLNTYQHKVNAQEDTRPGVFATNSNNESPIRVHYGYFPEASPIRVACARGWFKFMQYEVTCYPQTSGMSN